MKKQALRDIMNLAWRFVKCNGYTLSEALKTAWLNFKLKVRMAKGIVKFYFQKVNGDLREAYGTLAENLIPATQDTGRKPNPTVQTFFDTEIGEWRCFKLANLTRIA
jgi:hypothetical protein